MEEQHHNQYSNNTPLLKLLPQSTEQQDHMSPRKKLHCARHNYIWHLIQSTEHIFFFPNLSRTWKVLIKMFWVVIPRVSKGNKFVWFRIKHLVKRNLGLTLQNVLQANFVNVFTWTELSGPLSHRREGVWIYINWGTWEVKTSSSSSPKMHKMNCSVCLFPEAGAWPCRDNLLWTLERKELREFLQGLVCLNWGFNTGCECVLEEWRILGQCEGQYCKIKRRNY